jgi:hypothetical protein
MLEFYWSLGRDIVALEAESQWGSGFFNQLSFDLKRIFPGESGFSVTNLKYMKRWYLFYFENVINRQQLSDEFAVSKRHQPSDELEMPDKFALVPWKHHVALFSKCQSLDESTYQIEQIVQRTILEDKLKKQKKNV